MWIESGQLQVCYHDIILFSPHHHSWWFCQQLFWISNEWLRMKLRLGFTIYWNVTKLTVKTITHIVIVSNTKQFQRPENKHIHGNLQSKYKCCNLGIEILLMHIFLHKSRIVDPTIMANFIQFRFIFKIQKQVKFWSVEIVYAGENAPNKRFLTNVCL